MSAAEQLPEIRAYDFDLAQKLVAFRHMAKNLHLDGAMVASCEDRIRQGHAQYRNPMGEIRCVREARMEALDGIIYMAFALDAADAESQQGIIATATAFSSALWGLESIPME